MSIEEMSEVRTWVDYVSFRDPPDSVPYVMRIALGGGNVLSTHQPMKPRHARMKDGADIIRDVTRLEHSGPEAFTII